MARGRLSGPPVPPEQGLAWLARHLVERVAGKWDSVAVFTGEERVSKSTGILRTVEEIQRLTGQPFDWSRLTYGARDLLHAYRSAPPASVVWYDEGTRGLLAGDTFDPEQRVLTNLLAMAGTKRVILLLAIPDIWLLAKKVRGRRAVYWVHVDSRGTEDRPAPSHAVVHERDRRLWYQPTSNLRLERSLTCPELTFLPYAEKDPLWKRYTAVKENKLDGWFDEAEIILDRHEDKTFGRVLGGGKFEGRFVTVRPTSVGTGPKTFAMENKKGVLLGTVAWHDPAKSYVFTPEPGTLFDAICSTEIALFLKHIPRAPARRRV